MSLPCNLFVTKDYANATYLTISNAKNIYLSKSDAISTYLSIQSANNFFLTKINAASTYLSLDDASNLYLSITDASSVYLKKNIAIQTYVDFTSTQTITGTKTFNTIYLSSTVYDSTNSTGSTGQVLSTTESGVMWIDVSSSVTGSYLKYPIAQGTQTMLNTDVSGSLVVSNTITVGNSDTNDTSFLSLSPTIFTSNNYDGTTLYNINIGQITLDNIQYNGISINNITNDISNYVVFTSNQIFYYDIIYGYFSSYITDIISCGYINKYQGIVTLSGGSPQTIYNTTTFNTIYLSSSVYDSSNSSGSNGQFLSSTSSGVKWMDISTPDLSNYLTTTDASNTYVDFTSDQTITGQKTFSDIITIPNTLNVLNPSNPLYLFPYQASNIQVGSTTYNLTITTGIQLPRYIDSVDTTSSIYVGYNHTGGYLYINLPIVLEGESTSNAIYLNYIHPKIENTGMLYIGNALTTGNIMIGNSSMTGTCTIECSGITIPNLVKSVKATDPIYLFPVQSSIITIGSITYNTSSTTGIQLPKYIDSVDTTSGIFLGYNHTGGYLNSNLAIVLDGNTTSNAIYLNYIHPRTENTGTLYIGNALTTGNIIIGNSSMTGTCTIESSGITLPNSIRSVNSSSSIYLFPSQSSLIEIGSTTYNTLSTTGIRLPKYIDSVDTTSGIFLGYNHTAGYLNSNLAIVLNGETTSNAIYLNYLHPRYEDTGTLYIGSALTSGDINIGNSTMTGTINIYGSVDGSFNIGTNVSGGTITIGGSNSDINIESSIGVSLTNIKSGYNYIGNICQSILPANKIVSTASSSGTFIAYTPNTTTILPNGSYMITMAGCFTISGSPGSGTISAFEYGYYHGTNTTTISNDKIAVYSLQTPYTINNGINGDRSFSFAYPVQNTTPQYINGYASCTGTIGVGTIQMCILSYSIQRIG